MIVSELIAELSKYPPDIKVLTTWEGVLRNIRPKNIYKSQDDVLLIDADNNSYKQEFVSGKEKANFPHYPT